MRLLVTGFPAFLTVRRNPSEILIRQLQHENWTVSEDCRTDYAVLPMDYEETRRIIQGFFDDDPPAVIVHLGLASSATKIRLERRAQNVICPLDPSKRVKLAEAAPDDIGKVTEAGEDYLPSTLPLEDIAAALQAQNIPCEFSDDAGSYLCNFTAYVTAQEIRQRGLQTQAGFIHIPFTIAEHDILQDCGAEENAPHLMTAETLMAGMKTALQICAAAESRQS
ncbi:MAG: hypothetical protein EP349_06580 [Alphaproteobacteria bacterium]|nr:MAG: hypothetical protein EP349_06580 [Alphaproteobacteria bacterium]